MSEDDVSRIVVPAALDVHTALGPGLLESVYEACLSHELTVRGLRVERQKGMPVIYDGIRMDSGFRVDLLVNEIVVIEIKATERLQAIHVAQVMTYLRLGQFRLGMLLNFNVVHMRDGIKRVVRNL